jgi:hypothetical protein
MGLYFILSYVLNRVRHILRTVYGVDYLVVCPVLGISSDLTLHLLRQFVLVSFILSLGCMGRWRCSCIKRWKYSFTRT